MSIVINLNLMIKFILALAAFIAAVYGISYFWTNSSSKGKKKITLSFNNSLYIWYISHNLLNF